MKVVGLTNKSKVLFQEHNFFLGRTVSFLLIDDLNVISSAAMATTVIQTQTSPDFGAQNS